jgi:hypothetical protein
MKAKGRCKGSGARVTSGQLVGLMLQQQSEDEADQLMGGQDEGAAMFEAHGFAILTLVESPIVRGFEAHAIGALDEIVVQMVMPVFAMRRALPLSLPDSRRGYHSPADFARADCP